VNEAVAAGGGGRIATFRDETGKTSGGCGERVRMIGLSREDDLRDALSGRL